MGEVYVWNEMGTGNWEAPRGKGKFDIETGWAQKVVERYAPTYLLPPLSSIYIYTHIVCIYIYMHTHTLFMYSTYINCIYIYIHIYAYIPHSYLKTCLQFFCICRSIARISHRGGRQEWGQRKSKDPQSASEVSGLRQLKHILRWDSGFLQIFAAAHWHWTWNFAL